jgi:hypothetical protein
LLFSPEAIFSRCSEIAFSQFQGMPLYLDWPIHSGYALQPGDFGSLPVQDANRVQGLLNSGACATWRVHLGSIKHIFRLVSGDDHHRTERPALPHRSALSRRSRVEATLRA